MTALEPGTLVAENTRTASRPAPCRLCDRAILPGQRLADLADGSGAAHTGCIVAAAAPRGE